MSQSIYQYIKTLPSEKIAYIDIDGTLTANPWDTAEKDLLDKDLTNQAIHALQKRGYLCILNTSRTAEMCMSEKQFHLSKRRYGFSRPEPHMGRENEERIYIKQEDFFPTGILDLPIIISSSGAQVSVLQNEGGYINDIDFYPEGFSTPSEWRSDIMILLSSFRTPFTLGEIELEKSYTDGITDIFPADYRIQLIFSSCEELNRFSKEVHKQRGLHITNDSNPDKNMYSAYITPKNGKIDAIEYVLSNFDKPPNEILIMGDSLPDLEAGLHVNGPYGSYISFFLVGGSRLYPYLADKDKNTFAGVSLSIAKNLISSPPVDRRIVLSDALFPGSVGPRSIVEFLGEKDYNVGYSG